MELAFVTPTIGRIPELDKLLTSLRCVLSEQDECIVVAQGNVSAVRALVAQHAASGLAVRCIESPRGASLGRNWGTREVSSINPLLIFPNDSNWFSEETISALRALPKSFAVGSMTMVDSGGARFTLPSPDTPLDMWNVWKVLEATLLVRKEIYMLSGGFDENLGTGAPTPWQAGEATDFLLRNCVFGENKFDWLPAPIIVHGISETAHLDKGSRRRKLRAYGRGTGSVIRRFKYPKLWQAAFVGAGLFAGARSSSYAISDGPWAFIGRLEGILGITFGSDMLKAVSK